MPTHSLLPYMESPNGLTQDILISNNASIPGPGSSMTPHTGGSVPLSCMFCDHTFTHQDELGPHVLTQHPTTFSEPAVLRVEAEFRIPGERPRSRPNSVPVEKEEVHRCIVCGQVSQDASELETHMRKHKDYFTYCCSVCGRRFREPWFLKNHMKMHVKPGPKSKAQQDLETPVTVNGIVQDAAPELVATAYRMCMVCGFFFLDHDTLVEHSKVHNREVEPGKERNKEDTDSTTKSVASQEAFLHNLRLLPRSTGNGLRHERSSKWIPQLDPFNTYQAWQLATKGKIAVGPNTTKDVGQEASTDNEECGSDKEESSNAWSEGQSERVAKEGVGSELRSQQQAAGGNPEPQRRSLIQKEKDKERPTTCEECQRTFRTYHQLVLHSRVHKRERGGEESPISVDGKLSRAASHEHQEDGSEEGFEEPSSKENLGSGEDGFDRSKLKSKGCSYCGKSFRSSYYLTVHLRTHTGEKPFKCVYCDYAAAQKTSLKYHLDRRHKDRPPVDRPPVDRPPVDRPPVDRPPVDRPQVDRPPVDRPPVDRPPVDRPPVDRPQVDRPPVDLPNRPVPSVPSPDDGQHGNEVENPAPNGSQLCVPGERSCTGGTPEDRFDSVGSRRGKPPIQMNSENEEIIAKPAHSPIDDAVKTPGPVNLKTEGIREEGSETPLNLSFKVSLSISARAEPRNALIPTACSFCAYKTMYPEVLMIHKKMTHKDSDGTKRNGFGGDVKHKRLTGCPPALNGRDVTTLPTIDRRHPRRTKSPPRPPANAPDKTTVNPPRGLERSPIHAPLGGDVVVQEPQRHRQNIDTRPGPEPPKYSEILRKSNTGSKYVMDRPGPPDRLGIGERSYPARGGVNWNSDAARLCLSSRFGGLPPMDFGEPMSKRLKYTVPPVWEADTVERAGFRGPAVNGTSRLLISGRSVKPTSQGSAPSAASENGGHLKATPTALGSLDDDWRMMSFLHPYATNELASLYHGTPVTHGHGGLVNPKAGGRTLLYQHLPTLPNLQMRDPSAFFPNQRYGSTDKSA